MGQRSEEREVSGAAFREKVCNALSDIVKRSELRVEIAPPLSGGDRRGYLRVKKAFIFFAQKQFCRTGEMLTMTMIPNPQLTAKNFPRHQSHCRAVLSTSHTEPKRAFWFPRHVLPSGMKAQIVLPTLVPSMVVLVLNLFLPASWPPDENANSDHRRQRGCSHACNHPYNSAACPCSALMSQP